MKNLVWVEKYRPSTLDEFIASDEFKETIRGLISDPKAMPHFLFYSQSPGTGKTSLAYVIKNEIKCSNNDFLILNSSDERKIETIRGKVKDFALTMSSRPNIPRIVLMDEFDGMLSSSQEALRFIMEKYSSNCKFILTANDITKIIEPISSRVIPIEIRGVSKEEIYKKIKFIVTQEALAIEHKESIIVEDDALKKLVDMYYPDVRSMINKLQEIFPIVKAEKITAPQTQELEVWQIIKNIKPFEAREYIIKNGLNCRVLLKFLVNKVIYDKELQSLPEWSEKTKEILWYSADIDYHMRMGADEDIQMLAWILRFLNIFRAKA